MTTRIMGHITQLLPEKYQALSYTLSEDEDFLNVFQDGKQVATFNAHAATMEQVNAFIENKEIAESMKDFWKHTGNAD